VGGGRGGEQLPSKKKSGGGKGESWRSPGFLRHSTTPKHTWRDLRQKRITKGGSCNFLEGTIKEGGRRPGDDKARVGGAGKM